MSLWLKSLINHSKEKIVSEEDIVIQYFCEECCQWINAEEYDYGHDCEWKLNES